MKNSVTIKGFLPKTDIQLAERINSKHKRILESYGYDVPSNNIEWYSNPNTICFYAVENANNDILCAYRHEFICDKNTILNTPFVKGIDIEKHQNVIDRLKEFSLEGSYSETCAFWCAPEMKYKKSNLAKLLFTYGIYTSFMNKTKNVVGLAPNHLVDYYSSYGLCLDEKVCCCIDYSEQKHPSFLVSFKKEKMNVQLFEMVEKAVKVPKSLILSPFEGIYLNFEEPIMLL